MTRGYGFRVNFSVPELSETVRQIKYYDGKTALKVEEQVKKSTRVIGDGARRRVRVLSGDLKKSISTRFDAKTITGYIAARQPYAHLVEFGAKATVTKPTRQRKALKIPWKGGLGIGGMYYATKADIPKRRERPFMRPAFEEEKPNLIKGIKEAVKP